MPTIILDEEWTLESTGVVKNPGTQLVFARGADEAQRILDSDAGHILGTNDQDPEDAESSPTETKKSDRVRNKMEQPPVPLPEDFPAFEILEGAGLVTVQQVDDAKDRDLLAIDGIGDKTLIEIREALK